MDHAWDLLGEWNAELGDSDHYGTVSGRLVFDSWTEAELQFDPLEAALGGYDPVITLERASRVHRTDAGGGALQWVLLAKDQRWLAQITLWPGSLHAFVHDTDEDGRQIFRVHATRSREYFLQKYPLVTT